jgi:hypothetical protein
MLRPILIALFPILTIGPHVIPLPDAPVAGGAGKFEPPDVNDKGDKLPDNARMAVLAKEDSVAFLKKCLIRYNREVNGYNLTMQKQERIQGKLNKPEIIDVHFKHGPAEDGHSVFMRWREGARLAARVVYVAGENKGRDGKSKMIVKPTGLGSLFTVERDPEGEDARKSGRYTLNEFGLKMGLERTLVSFEAAQKEGALHVEYLGRKKIKEAGDRECFVLKRTRYARPEGDGITEQTLYVDIENWLLVGSILRGAGGQLIGEYFFRDIRLNPQFDKDQFTPKAVEGK